MNNLLPDIQHMDMNYSKYYLVPWPDCQKFEEMDPDNFYTIPTYVDGVPVCFVDSEWFVDDDEEDNA